MSYICPSESISTPISPESERTTSNSTEVVSKIAPVVGQVQLQAQSQPTTPGKTQIPDIQKLGPTLPSGVPVVQVQANALGTEVVSKLAMGLLGHVLFLKNQIPLPVPQLAKMSSTKSATSKAGKARADLLASFDILSSHLTTTFAALSVALYQCSSDEKRRKLLSEATDSKVKSGAEASDGRDEVLEHAYFAVMCGPSLMTARSRTFLAVDKFAAREGVVKDGNDENSGARKELFGIRGEPSQDAKHGDESTTTTGSESEDDEEADGYSTAEEPEDSEEDDDSDEDGEDSEPAQSLRPEGLSTPSRAFQIARDDDSRPAAPRAFGTPLQPNSNPFVRSLQTLQPPLTPHVLPLKQLRATVKLRASSEPPLSPAPVTSTTYAEEQRFLVNTERLMSRILATADSEGYGFSSELAPTQTHILLRAPRCFSHPAWIPRQNLTKAMESSLTDFLHASRAPAREPVDAPLTAQEKARQKKNLQKQQLSEGVWVTAKGGLDIPETLEGKEDGDGEDDMIWWSWDGKFVGFSDW